MKRLTMSLDDELAAAFERLVHERGYENRSEAFRDLLRADLRDAHFREQPQHPCIGTLSYVYDHHQRRLALRLADLQHEHHALVISTVHAHLDPANCLETVMLRGPADAVRRLAEAVMAQPGVSHGHLHLVPVAHGAGEGSHGHGHGAAPAAKRRPRSPRSD